MNGAASATVGPTGTGPSTPGWLRRQLQEPGHDVQPGRRAETRESAA